MTSPLAVVHVCGYSMILPFSVYLNAYGRIYARERRNESMIKLFELWTRRPDMTHEEAVRHWTEVHAPLVKKTFGDRIIKYVTNVGLPLDTRGWSRNEAPPYDGVAEFWIDMTVEELSRAIRDTAHILWPDEQAFIGTYRPMLVEEIVQKDISTTSAPGMS